MGRFRGPHIAVLSAKAATGIGTTLDVRDFRHIVIQVTTASSGSLTVKFQGSDADTEPTFSSAASGTNPWEYVAANALNDGTVLDGDTGVVFAGTDGVQYFMLNTDAISWFNCNVTARVAGNVTVKVRGYSEELGGC
jgi:hypothetical protein